MNISVFSESVFGGAFLLEFVSSKFVHALGFVGFNKVEEPLRRPSSPWMPFPTLISVLSKFLSQPRITLISKYHKDHKVSDTKFVMGF